MVATIRKPNAFTLVELLTVIIIIALLAAILLPTVTSALKTGYTAQSKTRVESLSRGAELYKKEYDLYPGQSTALMGFLNAQTYSGSQVLAACMYNYDVANASPVPKGGFDTYKDEFLQSLQVSAGTNPRPRVLTDGFPPGKAWAILYYPSVPGEDPTSVLTHYKYDHNKVHTNFKPVNDSADEATQKNVFSTAGGGFVVDTRFSPARPYRASEFLIIAPGADRKYFTSDDIKNF